MTIREYFERFHRRVSYITVVVAMVMFALVQLIYPDLTRVENLAIGVLAAIPISIVLILVFRFGLRCPRCDSRVANLPRKDPRRFTVDFRTFWEARSACQNCGLSFDEQYRTNADR
jgi:hypothetical protein